MSNFSHVRVRFAPSPTGHLHIGSLRTALFNYLFARHNNGTYLVRIEDTDTQRSTQEFTDSILHSLEWAELEPDEPIVVQSERTDAHLAVIDQLLALGKAYRCFCSPDDLLARYKTVGPDPAFIKYDGYCRERRAHDPNPGEPFAIRFAIPRDIDHVSFTDLIRGQVTIETDQLDDFVIARSDGRPVYNFVVVVDDAFMKISHVIRGEDHISNTPKQILLYQACGYPLPRFAHMPLILGPSGDRLSKRDAATSVMEYKTAGYLPEAFLNYLARLGWAHGDQEIFSNDELIKYFTLEAVGKKGAIFDQKKLDWVNSMHARVKTALELYEYIKKEIDPEMPKLLHSWNDDQILQAIELFKERVSTLCELCDELIALHDGPSAFDDVLLQECVRTDTVSHLQAVSRALSEISDFLPDQIEQELKKVVGASGIKFVQIAQPLRLALIGKFSGPGLNRMFALLGRAHGLSRIQKLIERITTVSQS